MTVDAFTMYEEKSFWTRDWGPYAPNPPLNESIQVDVAVVGGGLLISSQLGVSERTLQRRLRDKNIVFSDLVDNIRKSIALEYVRGTTYRLTDVAQMLGYTDPSSFTRAFKRWTDSSPMKIRNEAKRPAEEF